MTSLHLDRALQVTFRVIPTYYISNIIGFLSLPGPGDNRVTWQRTIQTITATNTWHWYEMINPYTMPAWTVSTLAAFYGVFPFLLSRSEHYHTDLIQLFFKVCRTYPPGTSPSSWSSSTMSNASLTSSLSMLQKVAECRTLHVATLSQGNVTSYHPHNHMLVRLPVFAMGVAAGLLKLRQEEDKLHTRNILHNIFPWTFSVSPTKSLTQEEAERSWKNTVDHGALVLMMVVLASLARSAVPAMPYINLATQFVFVHLQLVIIQGLTRDGAKSWLARLCR